MNHQLLTFLWDGSGPALCLSLPQAASHVGWAPTNAEAKNAFGSLESLGSPSSLGTFFPSLNDSIEDMLCSQSFFDDGVGSQASFVNCTEAGDFDLSFLPLSPESLDYVHVQEMDSGMQPIGLKVMSNAADKQNDIVKRSVTPENIKVEQAVGDPDVALSLIQQLGGDQTSDSVTLSLAGSPSVQYNLDANYAPTNVVPIDDTLLIPDHTQAASTAFQLMSAAPTDTMSFLVDSLFVGSHYSNDLESVPSSNVIPSAPVATTLRDLVSSPNVQQVVLPVSTVSSQSGSPVSMDSISFGDIMVPQQTESLVMRPEKRQRKKDQNKNAALKYRQKKRVEQGNFLSECLEEEKRNSELKLRVSEITREINYLKGLLLEISTA